MHPRSASSALCSSHKSTKRKLLGSYVIKVDHVRVFSAADALHRLNLAHDQGVADKIQVKFALAPKLTASDVCRRANEDGSFATNAKWDANEDIVEDEPFMDRPSN